MEIELFVNYTIRKKIYFDTKKEIDLLQTKIASLNFKIKTAKIMDNPSCVHINNDLSSTVVYKETLENKLENELLLFSKNKSLFMESCDEIENMKKEYDNLPNLRSKEKNLFYIFYYREYSIVSQSLEEISLILDITFDYTRKLHQRLKKIIYERTNSIIT